jgi:hypothetical protein
MIKLSKNEPWNFKLVRNIYFSEGTKNYDGMSCENRLFEVLMYKILKKNYNLTFKSFLNIIVKFSNISNKSEINVIHNFNNLLNDLISRLKHLINEDDTVPLIIKSSGNYKFRVYKKEINRLNEILEIVDLCYGSYYFIF